VTIPLGYRATPSAWLATVALTLGLGLAGCGDAGTAPDGAPGAETAAVERSLEPSPPFDLARLGGGRVTSDELAGRIVIVDFWATWCPPCEFQVPGLNAFWEAHRDEPDIALFGISVDTAGEDVVADWVAQKDVRYPVLLDGEPLARKIGALGFPTLLIITPDGLVHEQHVGLIERATLEEAVAQLRAPRAEPEAPPEAPPAAG